MCKKVSSERHLDQELAKCKIGTTDRKYPKTFYVEIDTFIEPECSLEPLSYKNNVNKLYKYINKSIQEVLTSLKPDFDDNFILNFEISDERMACDKRSYLCVQYFLKQNNHYDFNELISNYSEQFIGKIYNGIVKKNEELKFIMHKTKK